MSDFISAGGAAGLSGGADEAGDALSDVGRKAADAADAIDQAFDRAGASLAKSLAKAASDGKLSLGELASAAISAVDAFAGASPAGGGLAGALTQVFKAALPSLTGARADGGAVSAGGAYLVGERGPELFRPSASGEIAPAATSGGVVVNVSVAGGAPALLRSEAQVASALARAVAVGAAR